MSFQKRIRATVKNHSLKLAGLDVSSIDHPRSILIIPDGNARWAEAHGKLISEGHSFGAITMKRILEEFMSLTTKVIGVWGFSEDNWKRSPTEIDHVFKVVQDVTEKSLETFQKNGIKFMVLGKRDRIKKEFPKIMKSIEHAERKTSGNTKKILALFLDYGERFVLEEFAKARSKNKKMPTYKLLSKVNRGLPLFEMIVRTSGEHRLSGFGPLTSLAEFVSIAHNLPEMTSRDLVNALKEFSRRQRRFGGRNSSERLIKSPNLFEPLPAFAKTSS